MQSSKKITRGFIEDYISNSTQAALDLKAPLANPTFTGNVVVPNGDQPNEAVNKGQLDSAVSGTVSGTINRIPKFTSANTLGDSLAFENNWGLAVKNPTASLFSELTVYSDDLLNNLQLGIYNSANINSGTAFILAAGNSTKLNMYVGNSLVPFMSVRDTGNVLIATATDNTIDKLQVNGSGSFLGFINIDAGRPIKIDANIGSVRIKSDSTGWNTGYFFNGALNTDLGGFGTLGFNDALNYYYVGSSYDNASIIINPKIGGNGFVGIGTAVPNTKLDINASANHQIQFGSGLNGFTNDYLGGLFWTGNQFRLESTKVGTGPQPLNINPDGGNVLIGTTTDNTTDKLQVNGNILVNSNNGILALSNGTGFHYASVGFDNNFNFVEIKQNFAGSGGIKFITAGVNEQMRIGINGNVLIGTTADNGIDKLQVNGPIFSDGLRYSSAITISGQDLNNFLSAGFYDGNSFTNAPNSGYFYITVEVSSGTFVHQTATSFGVGNVANKVYNRVNVGGTWTSWAESQELLVSGTNIKTINNTSLLGSGDLPIDYLPVSVKNTSGSTINLGSVVYVTGGQGSNITIGLSLADTNINTSRVLGIVTSTIANNGFGTAITIGRITGVNTNAFPEGDKLYLSATTPGAFTNVAPSSPNHVVFIGTVVRQHATQGEIILRPDLPTTLDQLLNVQASTPVNNDLLVYETASTLWKNKSFITLGLTTGTGTTNTLTKWASSTTLGNSTITDTGSLITLGSNTTISTGNLTFGATLLSEKLLQMNNASLSTGLYNFASGGITMASATEVNIGAVQGWIVDSDDHLNSNPTFVNYAGTTNLTPTFIGSAAATYFLITPGSTLLQLNTRPTVTQRRDNIFLGVVGHPAGTLTGIGNSPDIIMNYGSQLRAMFEPTRLINEGVVPYAGAADLSLYNTAGKLYGLGIGFVTNGNDAPSLINIAGGAPMTTQYRTSVGIPSVGGTNRTTAVPDRYESGGVDIAIPGSGNQATNQRIYLLQNGVIRFQYGQTLYATLADAIAGATNEAFVVNINAINLGILIGILSIQKGATNLQNTAQARFLPVSKFGETVGAAAGISIGTLQTAYNNSAEPELLTNSTLGALSIRRGSAADTDAVIQIQNNAGTTNFSVTGNGVTTAVSFVKTGATATDALMGTGVSTILTAGTYAPTLTNIANTSLLSTNGTCSYMRIGNIVSVTVAVSLSITTTATFTNFSVTLPINRATSTGTTMGNGAVTFPGTGAYYTAIATSTATTTVNISFYPPTGSGSVGANISFQYDVTS